MYAHTTHTHAVYLLGNECIQDKACLKSQELHPVWKFFSSLIVFQYQLQGFHHTQWEWAFQQFQCLLPTGNNHSLWVWQQRKFSWKLKIFKSHRATYPLSIWEFFHPNWRYLFTTIKNSSGLPRASLIRTWEVLEGNCSPILLFWGILKHTHPVLQNNNDKPSSKGDLGGNLLS